MLHNILHQLHNIFHYILYNTLLKWSCKRKHKGCSWKLVRLLKPWLYKYKIGNAPWSATQRLPAGRAWFDFFHGFQIDNKWPSTKLMQSYFIQGQLICKIFFIGVLRCKKISNFISISWGEKGLKWITEQIYNVCTKYHWYKIGKIAKKP